MKLIIDIDTVNYNVCRIGGEDFGPVQQAVGKGIPLVEELKTGHWIKSSIGGAKVCSICQAHMGLSSFKFCPNCGASMESEEMI